MSIQEILEKLKARFKEVSFELVETKVDPFIKVPAKNIAEVAAFLKEDEALAFDSLMCLSGVDYPNTLAVVYHLFSFKHGHKLVLKVETPRDNPSVPTVENVWRTANWHEREAFDMFGIHFENHSDLRRILCPDDWEGYPLRKDYKTQEFYHGIRVEVVEPPDPLYEAKQKPKADKAAKPAGAAATKTAKLDPKATTEKKAE
jgi:NADH-quinone oxidoreductase subunit C